MFRAGKRVGHDEAPAAREPITSRVAPARGPNACRHRSAGAVGEAECPTCAGTVRLKVFTCKEFGECTVSRKVDGKGCCEGCDKRELPT